MFVRPTFMRKTLAAIACAAVVSAFGASANAGITTLPLGGGWQASWNDALNPFLSINSLGVVGDTLFIQKSAEFVNLNAIDVLFTQIGTQGGTVSKIAIDDEIISNNSGVAWTDFHMEVVPVISTAVFNPAASAGFSVAPFASSSFTNTDHTFNAFNGVIANGDVWFPGAAAGQLLINVVPTASVPASFILRETPSVPVPGALALIGVAGLVGARRRRR